MAYWDTSCLLKLYAPERDSAVYRARAMRGDLIITSDITRFELFAALSRKELVSDLHAGGAREALAAFDVDVQFTRIQVFRTPGVRAHFETVIEQLCRRAPAVFLRTLDAIHLATAITASESEMVSADARLREAAAAVGLQLFPAP